MAQNPFDEQNTEDSAGKDIYYDFPGPYSTPEMQKEYDRENSGKWKIRIKQVPKNSNKTKGKK